MPKIIDLKVFLCVICFLLSSLIFATGIQYQKRLLGDKAFDSGLYDVAMNYYENYLKEAGGDSPAIRDAYFCLISTCIRANNIEEAKKLLSEVSVKFQQFFSNHPEDMRTLNYWQAEILLYESEFNKAQVLFSEIITDPTAPKNDQIYLNALAGKALCILRMGDTNTAYSLFKDLKTEADSLKNVKVSEIAIREMLMIDLEMNRFDSAKMLIENQTDTAVAPDKNTLNLISIYILANENKLDEALNLYNAIRPSSFGPDYLWFFIAYSLSSDLVNQKKYAQAINLIDDAFALAPDMYDKENSTILKINIYIKMNSYNQAIDTARLFLETFSKAGVDAKIILALTEALAKEKRFSDINQLADKYFPADSPSNTRSESLDILFAQSAMETNNFTSADNYLATLLKNSTDPVILKNALFLKAESLYAQKKYQDALDAYSDIIKNYPDFEEKSLYRIAQIYITLNNYPEAEKTLSAFIQKFPDSSIEPSAYFSLGTVLENQEKYKMAIGIFSQFTDKYPNSNLTPDALYEAGAASLTIQDTKNSAFYLKKLIDLYPTSHLKQDALYRLIYSYIISNDIKNAETYTDMIVSEYPESSPAFQAKIWISNYYEQNKQFDQALSILDAIASSFKEPDYIARADFRKALIYSNIGNNDQALTLIDKLSSQFSDNPIISRALFLRGDILSSEGKYSKAAIAYQDALSKSASKDMSIASLGRIGDCYFAELNFSDDKNGVIDQAVQSYSKILTMEPVSIFIKTQTLYKLGKCYEELGNKTKAIESFHDAFYSNILKMNEGENPSKIWFVKSGIALTRLLQSENTPQDALAAIKALQELIKFKIEPVSDFQQRIEEIKNLYKLKEQ